MKLVEEFVNVSGGTTSAGGGGGGGGGAPHQDEELPMFSLEKVEYKPNGLQYMTVSNNVLIMALNLPRIFNIKNK